VIVYLLAIVPNISRELPFAADFLPHDHIFASDFLRRWTLGLQTECPDLGRAQHIEINLIPTGGPPKDDAPVELSGINENVWTKLTSLKKEHEPKPCAAAATAKKEPD
jgi:hypothetical protein